MSRCLLSPTIMVSVIRSKTMNPKLKRFGESDISMKNLFLMMWMCRLECRRFRFFRPIPLELSNFLGMHLDWWEMWSELSWICTVGHEAYD